MKNLIRRILRENEFDWVDSEMTNTTRLQLMNDALQEKGFKIEKESLGDIKSHIITDMDGTMVYQWMDEKDLETEEGRQKLFKRLLEIKKDLKGVYKRFLPDYETLITTLEVFLN
jgi:hypothetical protein